MHKKIRSHKHTAIKQPALLAGMLAASLAPGLAHADNSAQLDTVKVEATQNAERGSYISGTATLGKQKQALKDVPQAVSVITKQLMTDQGDSSLKEALKNVSGITFQAGEGGRAGDSVILRGFSAFGDTYRDGQRDTAQYNRDPFNDERIEVLKGASSMLFGRGSTGGIINQISKTPYAGTLTDLSTTVGTNDFYRATADINQALSDTAAIRLNVMGLKDGGADGVSQARRHGIAPSIAFGLNEPTTVVLSHMQLKESNTSFLGVPFDPNTRQPIDVPTDRYYGLKGMNNDDIESNITTARATHKFDSHNELAVQLRVGRFERQILDSQPRLSGVTAGTPITDDTKLVYSGKLRGAIAENQILSADYSSQFMTGDLEHNLLAGVEFTRETQTDDSISATSSISGIVASVGNPDASYSGGFSKARSRNFDTTNLAAYLTDTVTLSPQWKAMAGLRMDRLDGTYRTYSTSGSNLGEQTGEARRKDRGLSYRTGLIFQPTQQSSYYLGYSSLMNPSGEAYQFDLSSGMTDTQKPERNKHMELGAKWELAEGDATFRTAIFRTEKLFERNTDALAPNVSILYAKRHTDGIEFEIAGRLSEKWEVFAGATFMNPVIDEGWRNNAASDHNAGAIAKYTAKRTANLWSTYKLDEQLTVGGGLYYVGKRYASDGTSDQSSTNFAKGYLRADAMISYDAKPFTVRLNVNNLTNEKYYDALYGGHAAAAAPREVQLTVGYKY